MITNTDRLRAVLEAMEVPSVDWWMKRHPEVIRQLILTTVEQAKRVYGTNIVFTRIGNALKEYEPEVYAKMVDEGRV